VTATGEPTGREGDPLTPEGPVQIPPSPLVRELRNVEKSTFPGSFSLP